MRTDTGAGGGDSQPVGNSPLGDPSSEETREQLARIVASSGFRGSLSLTRFLRFVVEATLAGKADTLKAYTIAIEALGRGDDFDPQGDPIVRVEAGRLRSALARYYTGPGRDDPVVIEVRGAPMSRSFAERTRRGSIHPPRSKSPSTRLLSTQATAPRSRSGNAKLRPCWVPCISKFTR